MLFDGAIEVYYFSTYGNYSLRLIENLFSSDLSSLVYGSSKIGYIFKLFKVVNNRIS